MATARRGRPRKFGETYAAVMGRLVAEGVFVPEPPVPPVREPLVVLDVIEVGREEPRLLELLPALLVKRPGMFASRRGLPAELAAAVSRLRAGRTPGACFGIAGSKLKKAFHSVERSKPGTKLKAFRLTPGDQELLLELSEGLGLSETDVVRHALRVLGAQ